MTLSLSGRCRSGPIQWIVSYALFASQADRHRINKCANKYLNVIPKLVYDERSTSSKNRLSSARSNPNYQWWRWAKYRWWCHHSTRGVWWLASLNQLQELPADKNQNLFKMQMGISPAKDTMAETEQTGVWSRDVHVGSWWIARHFAMTKLTRLQAMHSCLCDIIRRGSAAVALCMASRFPIYSIVAADCK